MRTICVWIEDTVSNFEVCEKIANDFPCFFSIKNEMPLGWIEVSFLCRQEDASVIERRLSLLV